MRSSNSPFLYSLTILAVFAFSATAKSTPPTRPQSQIYSFALEERQPCPDNSTTSTCPTQTDITPCGDGTWCYLNYQCGTFLGRKGCCQDIFSGDKKIAPNKSCTAKLDVLGNMTWSPVTGNVSTIYPAFSFCTSTTLPAYQLMGSFSSSNETLAKGPKGEVCCPNVLDSVEYYPYDSVNPSQALCIAPFGMNIQTLLKGGSSSEGATTWRENFPLLLPLFAGSLVLHLV